METSLPVAIRIVSGLPPPTAGEDYHEVVVVPGLILLAADQNHAVRSVDGAAWELVPLPPGLTILDLWAGAADDVFASAAARLFHFDGRRWSEVRFAFALAADSILAGAGTTLFAVQPTIEDAGPGELHRLLRLTPW